jgi:hypothetical protein
MVSLKSASRRDCELHGEKTPVFLLNLWPRILSLHFGSGSELDADPKLGSKIGKAKLPVKKEKKSSFWKQMIAPQGGHIT